MEWRARLMLVVVSYATVTSGDSLGEADPQFSSPRGIIFKGNQQIQVEHRPDDQPYDGQDQNNYRSASIAQDRMDSGEGTVDPALLQAVLEDPVLLKAVDPRVLQAVLVSAAQANLAIPDNPQFSPAPSVPFPPALPASAPIFPPRPQNGPPSLPNPFGGAFSLPQSGVQSLQFGGAFDGFNRQQGSQDTRQRPQQSPVPQFGGAFDSFNRQPAQNNQQGPEQPSVQQFESALDSVNEIPVQNNQQRPEQPTVQQFEGDFQSFDSLSPAPSAQGQPNREPFRVDFPVEDFGGGGGMIQSEKLLFQDLQQGPEGVQRFGPNEIAQLTGPLQAMFHTPPPPSIERQPQNLQLTQQVDLPNMPSHPQNNHFAQHPSFSERLNVNPTLPPSVKNNPDFARTLAENPEVARELALQLQKDPNLLKFLGLSFDLSPQESTALTLPQQKSARQIAANPPAAPPGVCSLVTANGIPCDPGLAFSPLTGSCEWPDLLIEAGCNPEVVTGFGPCPQDASDQHLNPAQVASWPQPKFPINLDVVSVQNFDAVLAKKFFVVCVPTIYGKLFPRLICCPDYQFFDPNHVDGCVYPYPPLPPPPVPSLPLTYPLPPPSYGFPSLIAKRSLSQPSIEILKSDK